MKKSLSLFQKFIPFQKASSLLFTALAILILSLNSFDTLQNTLQILNQKKAMPFYFAGLKFLGLREIIGDIPYVGYYTDKDLTLKQNAAQVAQAQYFLAPVIIDINNTHHEFILFDCSNDAAAFKKMKEIRAVPFKKNKQGIILARKIK